MRNIRLSYVLTYLDNSWFWLGIWLIFYLRFTDYAGVGLLETMAFATVTLAEIPTGAVADLFGKKKTLIIGFILSGIASIMMGSANYYSTLLASLFVLGIGSALRSGTMEALQYDSLVDVGRQKTFDKVVANTATIRQIAYTVSAAAGGLMYKYMPGLPFIALGVLFFASAIICFLLKEPKTDTEKFSWSNYVSQTKKGFASLFGTLKNALTTKTLLVTGIFIMVVYQLIDSVLAVEFGFNETQLGFLASIIYIASAIASQFTLRITKGRDYLVLYSTLGVVVGLSLTISPILPMIIGGLILVFRQSLITIMDNLVSITINKQTKSNVRATTLSTYNMIRNAPYVLGAYFIGQTMDLFSGKVFALWLGAGLMVIGLLRMIRIRKVE